ncbi:trimeric intracellular cation channel family protein [Psychrobium sp. 1_MG-2023]|uniref:trimeric intracellular cation channel family protein n=1 Tax=Psychrobium sp. 1_MG-2023 TaxID=3062624 RepID=UPI00273248B2|nr:trimeric intracellular cation channel family protein [Psychrobium sp. 1_MG-2023]
MSALVNWLGLFGIAVFAVSGALDAARKHMDILGFMLIGTLTGLGGGTVRDVLLGRLPVYWTIDATFVGLCLLMSFITFFIAPKLDSRKKALIWMDALGLSLFCVTGAQIAVEIGAAPLICVCMGVITATFGGILRDVLCGYDLVLGSRELYVTTAVVGASVYLGLHWLGIGENIAVAGGFIAALTLRSAAIIWGLSLPSYRGQHNRN